MDINIIGFGLMGKQIASLLYLSSCNVHIHTQNDNANSLFDRQVKLLKRSMDEFSEGSVKFYSDISDMPNVATIESVVEDIDVKRSIYKKVRRTNNCDYYTNTSSYSPDEISEDVQGLHFFNPISLGLVEVSVSDIESSLIEKIKGLGFEVVSVNKNRGYIGNYILFHEISSALKLVEKFNYSVEKINQVYSKLYAKRDIFFIIDIIGVDVVFKILTNLKEDDETIYMPSLLTTALEKGVLGKKNKTSIKSVINEL